MRFVLAVAFCVFPTFAFSQEVVEEVVKDETPKQVAPILFDKKAPPPPSKDEVVEEVVKDETPPPTSVKKDEVVEIVKEKKEIIPPVQCQPKPTLFQRLFRWKRVGTSTRTVRYRINRQRPGCSRQCAK